MTLDDRLQRLREGLVGSETGADSMVVTGRSNVRYLSGFSGSAGALVVRADRAVLVTDGRYAEQAPREVPPCVEVEISVGGETREVIAALLSGDDAVAFEAEHLSWADADRWASALSARMVSTTGLVERLREIKDDDEVDRIRRAAATVDAALADVLAMLAEQPTEAAFAGELDAAIRRRGAAGNSFETIVAAGPNGALPHARPSGRRIQPGELVVIDVGAIVDGYCSDMTRTFCAGDADPQTVRHHRVVVEAQAAGVAALGPGVAVSDVDAACRAVIEDAGWGDRFTHGTGHGVGLDIHEAPRVAATGTATLRPGHVVTVEPGVYLPSHAGVRVEDLLVITDSGAEPLTMTPKTLTPDAIAAHR